MTEYTEDVSYSAYSEEHRIVQASEEEDEEETETQELEGTLSVKSEEGSRVKKFVVSYETKVLKSPSPAPSHGKYLRNVFHYALILKNDRQTSNIVKER